MNFIRPLFVALVISGCSLSFAADGLIAVKSTVSVKQTIDQLESNAKQRGLTVFARIDHSAGAAKIGKTIRPAEVLIFGNPQGGTPLMECSQTLGIDLPLKALAWEDESGQVWLGYNDPMFLTKRHGAPQCPAAPGVQKALSSLVDASVGH